MSIIVASMLEREYNLFLDTQVGWKLEMLCCLLQGGSFIVCPSKEPIGVEEASSITRGVLD